MSTLSSSLNSSAASALNDLGFWRGEDVAAARRRLRWCRGLTIAFGAVQMAVALGAQYSSQSVINDALTITGFTTGVLLGIFGLGQFSRVGPRAALAGVAAGIAAVTAVKFCTPLAWPWFTVAGALATVLIGWAAGTILHEKKP
jgi:Na+/proline symporter